MKMKKITASLLLAACTFACACGDKGSGGPVTGGIVNDISKNQYVEGMLHDVNVDFNAPVADFVKNGQTEYKIVSGDENGNRGASYIVEQVYKATGVEIKLVDLDTITVDENSKYILVGCEDLYIEKGGEMPDYDTIGVAGYKIETIGKNVFINANGTLEGYQMAALAFLREVIGYDMLAEDYVLYEKDGSVMPAMSILERPDFDYRHPNGTVSKIEQYGMGYTYIDPMVQGSEAWMHNIYDWVSKDEAAEVEAEHGWGWLSNDATQWQMCYTARGDKEAYTALINHLAEKVKGFLIKYPDKTAMLIGQHDIGQSTPQVQNCKCEACQASYVYYGNTMGAAWLSLCNRVSVVVDEWLKTDEAIEIFGEHKTWNLLQLVYHTQVNPPIERNSDGSYKYVNGKGVPLEEKWFDSNGNMMDWEDAWTDADTGESLESEPIAAWTDMRPEDRLYTAPNVHYMFATSGADWVHSYYEPENASWKNICDGWAGVSGSNVGIGGGDFYVWAYCLNSEYILYPYNSFDTSWETTRYFKGLGAKYMFWQGQYQNKNNAGFTKLRYYLDSKVEFDVNADYMYYVNKFFANFYGVAGDDMQLFFEQVQAHWDWMEEEKQVSGNIHNTKYGYAENWPEGLVNGWMDMLADAYQEVEDAYRVSDPELYEKYTNHLMTEELFPFIIQCTTYADSYDADTLKAMRLKFIDNFYALGNTSHAEGGLMTEITDLWDLD